MKAFVLVVLFVCSTAFAADQLECAQKQIEDVSEDWIDMVSPCVNKMRSQIQMELKAAMQYMAMGAHFSRDTINRPGFAKLFFEAASEERQHAIKLISYLLMRGELTSQVNQLIRKNLFPKDVSWTSGLAALKQALIMESDVTKSIREVIQVCESNSEHFNDYHLVDYLTGEFLEEQYHGQRDIAGKVSTLVKMLELNANKTGEAKPIALGEFLFDKKLLKGEL